MIPRAAADEAGDGYVVYVTAWRSAGCEGWIVGVGLVDASVGCEVVTVCLLSLLSFETAVLVLLLLVFFASMVGAAMAWGF